MSQRLKERLIWLLLWPFLSLVLVFIVALLTENQPQTTLITTVFVIILVFPVLSLAYGLQRVFLWKSVKGASLAALVSSLFWVLCGVMINKVLPQEGNPTFIAQFAITFVVYAVIVGILLNIKPIYALIHPSTRKKVTT